MNSFTRRDLLRLGCGVLHGCGIDSRTHTDSRSAQREIWRFPIFNYDRALNPDLICALRSFCVGRLIAHRPGVLRPSVSHNRFVDDRFPPEMPCGVFAVSERPGSGLPRPSGGARTAMIPRAAASTRDRDGEL
jgi:hypothetical protein